MPQNKFSVTLFLIALFVFLSVVIAMWISNIYFEKARYAEKTSVDVINCASFEFEISNIAYSGNTLSFDIQNSVGSKFEGIIIESDSGEMKEIPLENFEIGSFLHKTTDIKLTASFKAHPKGCSKNDYAKEYFI
jgi:hypothetical protein